MYVRTWVSVSGVPVIGGENGNHQGDHEGYPW